MFLLGLVSRLDFALGLDDVLGGVDHGAEDGPPEDVAVVDPDKVEDAAHVRVDGRVLGRPEPGNLVDQLRDERLEDGRDDDRLDALRCRAVDREVPRVAQTQVLAGFEESSGALFSESWKISYKNIL